MSRFEEDDPGGVCVYVLFVGVWPCLISLVSSAQHGPR